MGQVSRGSDNQPRTDAALFGHIAYRLEGKLGKELDDWAEELGIDVKEDGLRKASREALRLERRPGRRPALRKWLSVDWGELNFFTAAIRLRLEDDADVLAQLEQVPGVVDLYSLGGGAVAHLIVVYERLHDREALARTLTEFGKVEAWEPVDSHWPTAAISTSRHLALDAARREDLLLPDR